MKTIFSLVRLKVKCDGGIFRYVSIKKYIFFVFLGNY